MTLSKQKLELAGQVESLLRRNVIQGVQQQENVFSKLQVYRKREQFVLKVSLELRITKDTELGDNDSIKKAKNINRKKKHTGGCCGGH